MNKRLYKITASVIFVLIIALSCFAEAEQYSASLTKAYTLVTSQNPDNYAEIKIDKQVIKISGCFKYSAIKKIYFENADMISSTLNVSSDGSFNATLNPGSPNGPYDFIVFQTDNGTFYKYRVKYNNGWYFPDNNMSENNSKVPEKAGITNINASVRYLTDSVTRDNIEDTLEQAQKLSDDITKGIDDPYEKVVAIAKWVSDNIYYDEDAKNTSVTESTICVRNVIKSKKTVCGGYANLFCILAEAQGIPCVCVKGNAVSGSISYENLTNTGYNHEWNAVLIDGRWITVDTCWNSNNKYINGEYCKSTQYLKYLDPSPLAFSLTHAAYKAEYRNFFNTMQYFETDSASDSSAPSENSDNSFSSVSEASSSLSEAYSDAVNSESSSVYSMYEDLSDGEGTNTLLFIAALFVIAALITALIIILLKQKKDK